VGVGESVSPLQSFVFLGATVGVLWCMWLLLNLVFDLIEFWHDSLRAQRLADQARAGDLAKLKEAREASDSR
jgi:hypothetical protein